MLQPDHSFFSLFFSHSLPRFPSTNNLNHRLLYFCSERVRSPMALEKHGILSCCQTKHLRLCVGCVMQSSMRNSFSIKALGTTLLSLLRVPQVDQATQPS